MDFIENGVMLYKKGADPSVGPIDGKDVTAKLFDQDDENFDDESEGWLTHDEAWDDETLDVKKDDDKPKFK